MPTECNRDLFGYEVVEGRQVVAAFDGGQITSDAGALLLGAANRAIGLVRRLAGCFADGRAQELVEHAVETMVMQRICGIALGYEDLNDHDELRHDPLLAAVVGKLEARRPDRGAAGRQEHAQPPRTHAPARRRPLQEDRPRPAGDRAASSSTLFLQAHAQPPDADRPRPRRHRRPDPRPSAGPLLPRLLRLLLLSAAVHFLRRSPAGAPSCGPPTSTPRPGRSSRSQRIVAQIRAALAAGRDH